MGRKSPFSAHPEVAGRPRPRRPPASGSARERGARRAAGRRRTRGARRWNCSPRTRCSTPTALDMSLPGRVPAAGLLPSPHDRRAPDRRRVHEPGVPGRGRPGGRGRLAQLPGAEHPPRSPGPHDEGLVVRERAGSSRVAAADRDLGRAGPHDAVAAAPRVRRCARALLPARDGRSDAPPGLPSGRGVGGRRGHHVRRPQGHARGHGKALFGERTAGTARPGLLPVRRARVRGRRLVLQV